jgi:hypothetical protein
MPFNPSAFVGIIICFMPLARNVALSPTLAKYSVVPTRTATEAVEPADRRLGPFDDSDERHLSGRL